MRPIFKRYPVFIRPAALLMLVVTPIWWAALVLWEQRRELVDGYKEAWAFLRHGRKAAP